MLSTPSPTHILSNSSNRNASIYEQRRLLENIVQEGKLIKS